MSRVLYKLDDLIAPSGLTVGNSDRVKYIEAAYDTAMRAADTQKGAAMGAAQAQKESAITAAGDTLAGSLAGAEANYKRARVNYGVTAERMAQAGLTGSGYSDNLARDAYAMRQASMDNARVAYGDAVERANYAYGQAQREAYATHASEQSNAELAALEGLSAIGEQREKDYLSLLESAKTGALSPKDIALVTEGKGFSEDQVKQLKAEAEKQFRSEMLTYLDSTDPNMDYQTVEWAEGQGYITPDELQAIQTNWRQITNTGASAFQDDDGNYISKEAAKAYIDRYAANPWHSEEGLAELQAAYDNTYKPQTGVKDAEGKPDYKTKEGAVEYDRGKSRYGFGDEGDNFRLKVTQGKDEFRDKWFMVESGGQVIDNPRVEAAAEDVSEGVAFAYGGKVYIKDGGKVYLVRARGSNEKSYQELLDYLTKGRSFREPEKGNAKEWSRSRDWTKPSAF